MLIKPRGGKRKGAGRPPKGARAGAPHKKREFPHARYPVHVVLRVVAEVGQLRRRSVYHAIRTATRTAAHRDGFRIIHLSIQRTHVHLIIEADNKTALARGMQSFQISAAKHINAAIGKERPGPRRRGAVFPDRYHSELITSPRQARHTLIYVMNNFRKHQEDRGPIAGTWAIDWFSSACTFPDWKELAEHTLALQPPPTYEPVHVHSPRTWLLSDGWKKSGPISCFDIPSARQPSARLQQSTSARPINSSPSPSRS